MEDLKSELELCGLKRKNLRESFEQVNAQASAVLVFGLQLKELESHFDLVQQNIEDRLAVIESREKELEGKDKQLNLVEEQIRKSSDETDASKEELGCLRNSIVECSNQLDMKRNELIRSQEMIEDQCKQLNENEKKLDSIKSLIQDYEEELEDKKEKYEALEKYIRVNAAKLDDEEKKLRSIDEKISDRLQKLRLRNDELDSILKLSRKTEKQLESIKQEVDSKENCIQRYSKDIELKNQEFNAIKKSIKERIQELHSKEKQLGLVQISIEGCTQQLGAKEEELTSIKNSILECTKELESKQQQLETIQKTQQEISGVTESKEKQLELVEKACSERLQEADVKEKHLSSLERSLKERLEKMESEKRKFEARVKEFELREKQFASVQKAVEQRRKELESRERELTNAPHSQVSSENPNYFSWEAHGTTNTQSVNPVIPIQIKRENPEHFIFNASETSSAGLAVDATMGMDLHSILNKQYLNQPVLRKNEVLSALEMSPDPAKFVLDLMLGISSQHKEGGTGFEQSVLEISLVLEQLLQLSPHVQPKVKADALRLANEWKAKMKLNTENSIEILGFLQFVAAFGLGSSFNRDEIFKLIGTTAQHQQSQIVPEFIGSLIARKHYIEAVRFVCAFDCKGKYPPRDLFNLFINDIARVGQDCSKNGKNSPEVQLKAADEQMDALKSMIKCVKDCKLEQCVPVEIIEEWIAQLENLKMNPKFSAPAPADQPNERGWTTYNTGASVPGNQPSPILAVQGKFQGGMHAFTSETQPRGQFHGGIYASPQGTQPQGVSSKRARVDGLVINSYTPQVATVSPNIHRASPHGLGGPRGQALTHFGLPTNKEHSSTPATKQSNVVEANYLIHNRPKQP